MKYALIALLFLFHWTNPNDFQPLSEEYCFEEQVIEVNETVELALIIAALSELDRSTNNSINRDTDYYAELEEYFKDFRNHPVFERLGSEFNLPRLAGNAANYRFDEEGKLYLLKGSQDLWKDSAKNYFANNLNEIQDFADKTEYQKFYRSKQDLYASYVQNTAEAVDERDMLDWLSAQFDIEVRPVKVFISPLMSGFHWTTLYSKQQRIWINPLDPSKMKDLNEFEKLRYARVIFTELDHGYVNPVSSKHVKQIEVAMSDPEIWGNTRDAEYYFSPELKFNEYMTWSVYLLYVKDKLRDRQEEFNRIFQETSQSMTRGRGFIRFEAFAEKTLELYISKPSKKVQEIQMEMILWCTEYQASKE
ncbi:DUF4932 domain-containing protein [Lentiprolixibacter aurantiacus]|uniref:DUF4932 domain-containing protein n=1 Tax=Lentiprolixibacter aurantiacus TaxID=2993939 RepID=A0AAE3SLT1_9FLAO|nr:DUF4932 domain-containing protein [Lentiprolixibacter aurantiacus]MCX2718017.1 DUF4932 domain-containing protein [Lentiprolixibacter aurantiacus]